MKPSESVPSSVHEMQNDDSVSFLPGERDLEQVAFCEMERSPSVWDHTKEWFTARFVPSRSCVNASLRRHIPLVDHLSHYSWKKDLPNDVLSGVTVGVMHIPFGMAYGLMSTLPVIYGLHTSFFPVLIYSLLGTSRHISVGTFAVTCLMLAEMINNHQFQFASYVSVEVPESLSNDSLVSNFTVYAPVDDESPVEVEQKLLVAITITFVAGVIQLVLSFFHMGMVNTYLSDAVVGGVTTGAAFHILTSQVKDILGIRFKLAGGAHFFPRTWIEIFRHIGESNPATVIISAVSMTIVSVVKTHVNERFAKRLPFPVPVEMGMVVVATLVSSLANLEQRFSVRLVGTVPSGFPRPRLPVFSAMHLVLQDAIVMAVVSFALNVSVARLFAKKHEYRIDPTQELLAYGVGNVFSSFFESYVLCAALARSVVQEASGGRTQLAGLVSCAVVAIFLLFLGPLLQPLPQAVLASIVLVALKRMYLQVFDLRRLWRVDKLEMLVWIITFASVLIIDVAPGLLIGVVFNLFLLIVRAQLAAMALLGQLELAALRVNENLDTSRELPSTKILRFEHSLFYANAWRFKKLVREMAPLPGSKGCSGDSSRLHHLILDCSCISYADTAGAKAIAKIVKEYQAAQVSVHVCHCRESLLGVLQRGQFLQDVDKRVLQASIEAALEDVSCGKHAGEQQVTKC